MGAILSSAEVIAADSGGDPVNYFFQYGVIGVVLILLLLGWLVPKYVHDRAIAENKRKDEIIERKDEFIAELQSSISDRAIPALVEATSIMRSLPEAENNLLRQLTRFEQQMQDLNDEQRRAARRQSGSRD